MEVTLVSLEVSRLGNVTSVRISFTLRNTTLDLKRNRGWRINYEVGGGEHQNTVYNPELLPGQSASGRWTFHVQAPSVPVSVSYETDTDHLVWAVE